MPPWRSTIGVHTVVVMIQLVKDKPKAFTKGAVPQNSSNNFSKIIARYSQLRLNLGISS
jgi:hypothetical protein